MIHTLTRDTIATLAILSYILAWSTIAYRVVIRVRKGGQPQ